MKTNKPHYAIERRAKCGWVVLDRVTGAGFASVLAGHYKARDWPNTPLRLVHVDPQNQARPTEVVAIYA